MTINRIAQRMWSAWAVFSILPVLLVSYVCCNYEQSELLLSLFLVEWIVVLVVWRLLCPWLGRQSVAFAAVPFVLSFCVAAILTRERMAVYGAKWYWSDDWWYLTEAGRVVDSLRSTGWNLYEAWALLISRKYGAWTLAGWPFVLGLVSSFVTLDAPLELLHAIALSLNATFLALVLALVFHVLKEPARRFPWMVLLCFILLIADPVVYAANSLKESMLQLSLMLAFVFCVKLSEGIRVQWVILGVLGVLGVATMRPAYVPLLLFVMYLSSLGRVRLGTFLKVVLSLIIIASLGGLVLSIHIREAAVAELIRGRTLEAEAGLAMYVYNIPVAGPVLFYAISPVPPLPWKILSNTEPVITIMRGVGSAAWFFIACYVLRGLVRNRLLLKDKLFMAAVIMFTVLFMAVVLSGDDPRFKQPTNFYLAIMMFLTWYDRRIRRGCLPYQKVQVNPIRLIKNA